MQLQEYLLQYAAFHREFCPTATNEHKLDKLCCEIEEHIEAVDSHDRARVIDETIDVMNTAIAYLVSEGIENPLWSGYLKLEKTAKKYRERANEPTT